MYIDDYDNIIDSMMERDAAGKLMIIGMELSPLFPGRRDGKNCDCCFTCLESGDFLTGPYQMIYASVEGDMIVGVDCESEVVEFCPIDEATDDENALEQYLDLYLKVRDIAFEEELNDENKSIIKEFMTAWNRAFDKGMRDMTEKLFHEFVDWTNKL